MYNSVHSMLLPMFKKDIYILYTEPNGITYIGI